jgi:uncharacterized protein (DUF305 family)
MEGHGMGGGMMGHGMMGQGMMGHGTMRGGRHGSAGQPKGDAGPSSLTFRGINLKMHEKMDITFTGNADVDFVKGMIPHHQGAIDMAKTVLAFGKDPEVRKLAEEIIKAQESEVALMQTWLKLKGE